MAWALIHCDGFDVWNADEPAMEDLYTTRYGTVNVYNTGGRRNSGYLFCDSYTTYPRLSRQWLDQTSWRAGIIGLACYWPGPGYPTDSRYSPLYIWGPGEAKLTLSMDSSGQLNLYRGTYAGTLLASGTTVLALDTWHYIELRFYIDDTNGEYELRINGSTEYSATTVDTQSGSLNYWHGFGMYGQYSGGNGIRFDDLYVRADTTNTADGFWGDCEVHGGYPDGDGTNTDWTRSAGSTDYELIDEAPPVVTTDYLYSSTATNRFSVNVPANTTGKDIKGVQWMVHFDMGSGANRDIKLLCKSGATTDTGTAKTVQVNRYQDQYWENDPNTGSAWTTVNFNSAEFGAEVV